MIYEFLSLAIGVLKGTITGLIPGLHPNTVTFATLPLYFYLNLPLEIYLCFLLGMTISHTFHEFLPAIFLGAAQAESALSVIPGAEMAANGRGLEAFRYTVRGGIYSVLFLIIASPIIYFLATNYYQYIEQIMHFLLIFFLIFIIMYSGNRIYSASIAVLSGILGLLTFNTPVNIQYILVPVFAGLFAVPSIVDILENDLKIFQQENQKIKERKSSEGGFYGLLAGIVAGIIPGIGAAVATSFLTPMIKGSKEKFMASMGAVNTSDIIMSFIAIYLIGNPRSGAAVAVESIVEIDIQLIIFIIGFSLIGIVLSYLMTLKTPHLFLTFLERFEIKKTLTAMLLVITAITYFLTSFIGLLYLITASFIGYLALLTGERTACMASLIFPAIFFFI